MDTIIAQITHDEKKDEEIFKKASEILKNEGLVAFPTETVYGLGGNALDKEASAKIYKAKGRPSDNPLIVHISKVNDLYELSSDVNEWALKLADKFWPGPLTMILKKKDVVPDTITGGLGTVAIRMPNHKTALNLIEKSGVFIAAPSANISGKPSPTRGQHVIHDLDGRIDMIIVDDTVDIGVESTIVDLSESVPVILRPGYITKEMLSEVVGEVRIDPAIGKSVKDGVVPKAPGMKYKHYAPDADLAIIEGNLENVVKYINEQVKEKKQQGKKVAVMASKETKDMYECDIVEVVGSRENEASVAKNLYAALRYFDEIKADYVYSESFSEENVGCAVMNRLIKAAGHTIINV